MALMCPECHTLNDDRLGRCDACGCRLSGEVRPREWRDVIVPTIGIAVLIGLFAAVVLFLLRSRGG